MIDWDWQIPEQSRVGRIGFDFSRHDPSLFPRFVQRALEWELPTIILNANDKQIHLHADDIERLTIDSLLKMFDVRGLANIDVLRPLFDQYMVQLIDQDIHTSNFARYKSGDGVSIARFSPDWWLGDSCGELAPPEDLVRFYKAGGSDEEYTKRYMATTLRGKDPRAVYRRLKGKTMLCWCGKGKFCHRHLVAEWLQCHIGIEVKER